VTIRFSKGTLLHEVD